MDGWMGEMGWTGLGWAMGSWDGIGWGGCICALHLARIHFLFFFFFLKQTPFLVLRRYDTSLCMGFFGLCRFSCFPLRRSQAVFLGPRNLLSIYIYHVGVGVGCGLLMMGHGH